MEYIGRAFGTGWKHHPVPMAALGTGWNLTRCLNKALGTGFCFTQCLRSPTGGNWNTLWHRVRTTNRYLRLPFPLFGLMARYKLKSLNGTMVSQSVFGRRSRGSTPAQSTFFWRKKPLVRLKLPTDTKGVFFFSFPHLVFY